MFTWLNNLFPYSDLHSLNLDWLLSKMKETAAQAAQAIADSANALAQVLEAKLAAQNAQTAAENAQTAAQNAQTAANNAAGSAASAVDVAQTAQTTAQNAQTTAQNAQTAAENAQETADTTAAKFPIGTEDIQSSAVTADKIANSAVTTNKIANGAITSGKFQDSKWRIYYNKTTAITFSASTSNNISEIGTLLTNTTTSFITGLQGYYLQFVVELSLASGDPGFIFTFPPVPISQKSVGGVACAPFILLNTNTGDIITGKGIFKYTSLNLSFQLFFDETPEFDPETTFKITACRVGAQMGGE